MPGRGKWCFFKQFLQPRKPRLPDGFLAGDTGGHFGDIPIKNSQKNKGSLMGGT